MSIKKIHIEESWKSKLEDQFQQDYFKDIRDYISIAQGEGKIIYPSDDMIFNAFNLTSFDKVKVVIIGQDPYHGPGQAMGLSFSVPKGIRTPPSLKNIYKELNTDIGFTIPDHGDLSHWAKEGVFLLNAMLSVEHKKAGSHKKIGWQQFTDQVISLLSSQHTGLIFMLWGNFAKGKKELIDADKHLVLEAAHPSPLARGAFFGNRHFSKCNAYLIANNKRPIQWKL